MRNWIVLVTPEEAAALHHKAVVDRARWSEEEPDAVQKATEAVGYWDMVLTSRGHPQYDKD